MADGNRVSFSLTHVEYYEGDYIGYILAWCSLFPIFLLVSFVTLIAVRRNVHTICFFIGILLNESCNYVLKRVIKDPRPSADFNNSNSLAEYGMPSSHAQFMAFFSSYFTLFIFIRIVSSDEIKAYVIKGTLAGGTICGTILCCISRVYLGYHTFSQVIYGVMIGCILACIWFAIIQLVISPHFPRIYYWEITEALYLQDFSLIPNYFWYEFTAVRGETRNRLKRKSM